MHNKRAEESFPTISGRSACKPGVLSRRAVEAAIPIMRPLRFPKRALGFREGSSKSAKLVRVERDDRCGRLRSVADGVSQEDRSDINSERGQIRVNAVPSTTIKTRWPFRSSKSFGVRIFRPRQWARSRFCAVFDIRLRCLNSRIWLLALSSIALAVDLNGDRQLFLENTGCL